MNYEIHTVRSKLPTPVRSEDVGKPPGLNLHHQPNNVESQGWESEPETISLVRHPKQNGRQRNDTNVPKSPAWIPLPRKRA